MPREAHLQKCYQSLAAEQMEDEVERTHAFSTIPTIIPSKFPLRKQKSFISDILSDIKLLITKGY